MPAEGMVVLGGALGMFDPVAVLGPESAVREKLEAVVRDIEQLVRLLLLVPGAAAQAFIAQRQVLRVLVRSVRARIEHVARVCAPAVARPYLERVDSLLRTAAVQVLGWSAEEADEAWPALQLPQEYGGLGLEQLARLAEGYRLSAWLAAASTGRLGLPAGAERDPTGFWGGASSTANSARSLYRDFRKANPRLPPTLAEFGVWAESSEFADRGKGGQPRIRWFKALMKDMGKSTFQRWHKAASKQQRVLQSVRGHGRWMLQEAPRGRSSESRVTWLVAVRMWCGLDVVPAIPEGDQMAVKCQNVYAVSGEDVGHGHGTRGETCKSKARRGGPLEQTPLDRRGRHAATCKVGGMAIRKHNGVRDVLGYALKPLVSAVSWERAMPEIQRTDGGGEARLDLRVTDPANAAMLDVVVFWPLQKCGAKTYKHRAHERAKYVRYPTTRDGRRLTAVPLIPVVVSAFGCLNETAQAYLMQVEASARVKQRALYHEPAGPRSLSELVSLMAILETAAIVASAHSHRLDARAPRG